MHNTMELTDYFCKGGEGAAGSESCYSLDSVINLSATNLAKEADGSLAGVLDQLLILNPGFTTVAEVAELSEENCDCGNTRGQRDTPLPIDCMWDSCVFPY